MHVAEAAGEVDLETVSGGVHVSGASFSRVRVKSVSRAIEIDPGELKSDASVEVESHSGDVVLALPSAAAASFEVSTFTGDITFDLGGSGPTDKRSGPGHKLRFSTGPAGPGARVAVKTFSGAVHLKKR